MLTLDADELPIRYSSIFALMKDLKGMGENNAVWNRSHSLKRDTILAANAIYNTLYANEDKSAIPATFQIYYWIGWKPDPSQKKTLSSSNAECFLKRFGPIR
ncbi:NDUFAF5 [Lepeophtheirus salmonis]|uniref:NDUFAF5 n=1 Tax=Lepeophtheirus salmonis TaxID=72036 RepID=A0A7R8CWV3_LEPSM|nr:NDUFAF5 [Lepeophtheirus salmonis]CAF2925721.1 NDUFAF5 [Lepeophtheirus salmonis]